MDVIWRRAVAGPAVLVAGHAVIVPAAVADGLGMPGPAGWSRGLLLCVCGATGAPWARAGDPSTVIELLNGWWPADLGQRLPHVARGWPHQWSVPLGELVPDPLGQLCAIER